jgi:hypothetical protein
MKAALVERKSIALLLTGAYSLFCIQAIRGLSHAPRTHTYGSPVLTVIAYLFCVYFFIEIQRNKLNVFEKTMAWASAGVFVARTVPVLHIAFPSIPSFSVPASYSAAVLILIATLAIAARTVQLANGSGRAANNKQRRIS